MRIHISNTAYTTDNNIIIQVETTIRCRVDTCAIRFILQLVPHKCTVVDINGSGLTSQRSTTTGTTYIFVESTIRENSIGHFRKNSTTMSRTSIFPEIGIRHLTAVNICRRHWCIPSSTRATTTFYCITFKRAILNSNITHPSKQCPTATFCCRRLILGKGRIFNSQNSICRDIIFLTYCTPITSRWILSKRTIHYFRRSSCFLQEYGTSVTLSTGNRITRENTIGKIVSATRTSNGATVSRIGIILKRTTRKTPRHTGIGI